MPRRLQSPITFAVLAVNIAIYVLQQLAPGAFGVDLIAMSLALDARAVWEGEVWRLATSPFIHFHPLHIFFNMFVLWDLGRLCEAVIGPRRYAVLYAASALGGTVASTLFTQGLSGGASGALFGVAGALLALVLLDRDRQVFAQRERLRGMLVRFLVLNGVLQFMLPRIDIAAHMGGCVTGAVVAAYLFGKSPVSMNRGRAIRRIALALIALLVLTAAYAVHPIGHPRFERLHRDAHDLSVR